MFGFGVVGVAIRSRAGMPLSLFKLYVNFLLLSLLMGDC